MPETLDFESDQFLKLLTDALQCGPGTPQWHEAVQRLRASGEKEYDEYRLIVAARENLESGRDYRTVRAGPGFTRKLMDELDNEGQSKKPSIPTATIIAVVGILAIVAIVVAIAVMNRPVGPQPPKPPVASELMNTVFTGQVIESNFANSLGDGFKLIEKTDLQVKPSSGLKIVQPKNVDPKDTEYRGAGIVASSFITSGTAFEVNVTLKLDKPTDNLLAQLFVTDGDTFSEKTAQSTSPHEIVCWIQGGQIKVGGLPNVPVVVEPTKLDDSRDPTTAHLVLRMNKTDIVVKTSDGKTLYAGPHGLPDKQRYVGIRFKLKGNERPESVTVQSVRIQK